MNKAEYRRGQIVWSKIKGFPWWPSIVKFDFFLRKFQKNFSKENFLIKDSQNLC